MNVKWIHVLMVERVSSMSMTTRVHV